MGNAALRELAAIEQVSFDELTGVIAVDAHNWLYRYLTTTVRFTASDRYTTDAGEEVANLIGIVQGLPKFFEHDLTPVFVFDGGVTELKADEVAQRRERRERAEQRKADADDAAEIAKLDAQTQRLTETIQRTSRELLSLLDVPVVEAPAEGEAQCAYMTRIGDAAYAGTEDYDALLFGAPHTVRQLTSSGDPEVMELAATLSRHDITREQLVDAAMLCGTDFNEGISGIGPATAIDRIREHDDIFGVLDAENAAMPNADRVRALFRNPPVTDDYTIHEEIQPDTDAARAFVRDWEIPDEDVDRGFQRLDDALTQTGLDDWT